MEQSTHISAIKKIVFTILCLFFITDLFARDQVINLVVGYKTVYFAGKPQKAVAVNNQIPAPTLHFKEGDHVSINVYNCLNEETAIHWHGILVPWQMDGVKGVSQRGIRPGHSFHYEFTLKQAGTYWYHAHAGFQEQQGLYGAFLIDPLKPPKYKYDKDYVVVLSEWSNTHPDQIFANLKKEGDYYSPRFPLQPSLVKFIHDYQKADCAERKRLIDDYKMMQAMRMSIYDITDVAFDAYLLNGMTKCNPWRALVKVGDVVRLRFIGAAGTTLFRVKIPCSTMQMVHVQGNDVEPHMIEDFTISPGETYDVLVKIKKNEPYIIYTESADTLGTAIGALVTSPYQYIDFRSVVPFPEPLPVTREMMDNMMMSNMDHDRHSMEMKATSKKPHKMSSMSQVSMGHMPNDHKVRHAGMAREMKMKHGMGMEHAMHSMPIEPTITGDSIRSLEQAGKSNTTLGTKYENLTAGTKTNNPNKRIEGVIKMELFGYMDRFIWFINGLPEFKAHPIVLEPNQRYRIVFINNSMMHHPMHIHGHWFILRKGLGSYDPLLHTMDVAPGSTMVVDVDTDASGQWFFHCHLLYHMFAGMSRTFQYSSLIEIIQGEAEPQSIVKDTKYYNRPIVRVDAARPIDLPLVKHPMAHPHGWYFSTLLDIGEDPFKRVQRITYKGLYGPDYNKLELFINDMEIKKGTVENADIDIFYWHLIGQFWAIKGGLNYFYRPATTPYWQPGIGIEGLMPYFIDTNVRGYYKSGSAKLDIELSRDTQITNNFFIRLGIRSILASKTIASAGIGSGLNQMRYIVRPYYRLMPGLNLNVEFEHEQAYRSFRAILRRAGESTSENTLTFGLSFLF